jgi:signal transduction histidine kinase/CheY-like chemotaxis protein
MRDEVISAVDNLVQNGQRIPASEIGLMRKDGSIVPVYSTHVMLEDSVGQKELYCVDLDLSDLKKAEEERTTLRNQLMRAQKMEAIGTLAGGIAHDFNNLLQVVVGFSGLMIANPSLPDQFKRSIKSINKAALSGADLVSRLLTFARKTETWPTPLNLNDKIIQISELLDRSISKMIQIELRLSKSPALIDADASQIEQIIMNLAVNAGHAMPEGGKLVIETQAVNLDRAYCLIHAEATPGPHILLSLSDTGHGIDKKTMERIFEPFFTTKSHGTGTGLGLAMVYGIVKQHGGHTTCHSEPGVGATFKIYFPSIDSEVKPEKMKDLVIPKGGTETILLVDDDDSVRDVAEEMLLEYGYRVITASNGREALQIYSSERENISLVILDLFMPEMGGKECLRALLRMDPKVRVLLVSGFTQNGEIRDALDSGARGFIGKPVDIPQFLEKIRKIIDEE